MNLNVLCLLSGLRVKSFFTLAHERLRFKFLMALALNTNVFHFLPWACVEKILVVLAQCRVASYISASAYP